MLNNGWKNELMVEHHRYRRQMMLPCHHNRPMVHDHPNDPIMVHDHRNDPIVVNHGYNEPIMVTDRDNRPKFA